MKNSFEEIISSASPREEKAKQISDRIRRERKYSWVGIYDVTDQEIKIISCAGRSEPAFATFPRDKGLNGRAVSQGKTIVVNDIERDEDYLLTFTNTQSEIVVPVFGGDGKMILGSIDVESETKNAFGNDDVRFLEECAKNISGLWT